MAPTPQPTMTREQQQALAKARARARVGAQTVNPMVAQGQAAQQVWQDAGSKPANPNPENPIVTAQRNSQTQAMGQWAQQRVAERQAEATRAKARRESAAAFGGGMDMLPTEDAAGNVRPGTEIDADISKGIVTAPLQFGQGLGEGVANMANVGFAASTDLYNAGANLIDPQRAQIQPYKLEFPRNALLEGPGASVTGIAPRIAGQIMSARVPIGRAMPGGGFGAEVAKDAMAMGLGTPQDAPRLSDMIDPGTPVIGGIADFLRTNPGDNALAAAAKNAAEDLLISGGIGAALRGGATVLDSVGSRAPLPQTNAGGAAVRAPSQATAVQQSAPVTQVPMPQPASRAAQAGPSSAGQQPNAGNAAPAASAAPAAAQPVLNATPAVAQSPVALAKSDAKIIGRLLRAGGVARNDVDRTLAGLVQAYQSSNSSRLPLAFFAEEYLPTVLPKQAAEDVIQKLRGFGRERYSANGPRDSSRATMRETVDTLRGSQREVLTKEFEDTLGKETLLNKKGKIKRDKSSVAEAVYREELDRQQRLLDDGKATPEQVAARDDLLMLMGREDYFAEVPKELKIQALDEGRSSLWEFIHQNPIEAAHWMQSRMGELASKGNSIANTMRWPLVRRLEEAVPGYRGARLDYGDLFGQEKQIKFGDDLFSVAGNVLKTGEKAAEYKRLAPSQKTVAEKSIRDKLVNEFRKAKAGDDRAAVITQMQKDGVLDALETILGAKGRRVADGIRAMVKENDRLRAVDMLSGSNTADNLKQIEAAQEAVRSPVNKAIGAVGDKQSWTNTIVGDALLAANGLPPLLTGSKIATGVVGKFGSPGSKKLSSATRTLYGLPTQTSQNALAAGIEPPPARLKVEKPKPTKLTVTQDSLDALLKQYDQKPTAALRTKIIAARKALAKQPPANALASPPPSGPINRAGFGGGRSSSLDMSEPARMRKAFEQKIADLSERYRQADGAADRHYIQQEIYNLQDEIANLPSQSGSSKLLAGMGATPEAVSMAGGGVAGYASNPADANGDGVIDDADRGLNALGGMASGLVASKIIRGGVNAARGGAKPPVRYGGGPPLDLPASNRVFSPGQPDDLGFITSAENALANPVARFRDARKLTPDQWRKFFREGGASGESFEYQIEPALKSLADRGITGDITRAQIEEAMARNRGTMKQAGARSKADATQRERDIGERIRLDRSLGRETPQRVVDEYNTLRNNRAEGGIPKGTELETDYKEYVAPGKSSNYQQHVLTLPPEQGKGYRSHNWKSENPVGHIRFTNRTSANGEKVLHVEELQSDLHQEGAKYGYRGDKNSPAEAIKRAREDAEKAVSRWEEYRKSRPANERFPDPRRSDETPDWIDATGQEYFREANKKAWLADKMEKQGRHGPGQPPRAPLENWEEPFIRYALKQGADQGVDVVTFPKWTALNDALKNEGTAKFYDERMPRHLASVAKSLGLKVEKVPLHISDTRAKDAAEVIKTYEKDLKLLKDMKAGGHADPGGYVDQQIAAKEKTLTKWRGLQDEAVNGVGVPAIRLTPQAKQRLSEGVIMDAKDPGRRVAKLPEVKPPPAQAGFSFGGKGPSKPPNALAPPKKPPTPLSRAAEEATRELRAARSAHSRASNKWVMKDDRELRVKPLEDRVVQAEQKLATVLQNDARIKLAGARIKGTVEKTLNSQTRSVLGGVGLGVAGSTGLIFGYNALKGEDRGEKPMSPKDPRWFWSTVQNDKQTMVNVQKALREWGEWPQDETKHPNGATTYKDVEMSGRFGKTTKDALRSWRHARGLDPDAPMSKQDLTRLLSGPKGFQSDDGSWRYGDGEVARAQ